MAYESLLKDIRSLAQVAPQSIVLNLDDGSQFHYEGSALDFAAEAMRKGPVAKACARAVSASGCGFLWQLGAAFAAGPLDIQSKAPHKRRRTARRARRSKGKK